MIWLYIDTQHMLLTGLVDPGSGGISSGVGGPSSSSELENTASSAPPSGISPDESTK